jgi:hypothetical protein
VLAAVVFQDDDHDNVADVVHGESVGGHGAGAWWIRVGEVVLRAQDPLTEV